LDKTQARIHELAHAPVAAPAATGELQPLREQLEAAKSELDRQVSAAEKHAREAKKHEQELRDEIKKQKGRAETNNRVYLVTKGELELVKERLAQAERKLWQAGIPLAAPPAKERPKATGPAAADKQHEEGALAAEAAAVSAPPPPGEPISAGESPAEEMPAPADGTPPAGVSGVAPIRRRTPENGVEKPPQS